MGIFGYLKGMIALTILALIEYILFYSLKATAEQHGGDLSSLFLFALIATNLLFSVLLVGLFVSHWGLKKENKRLKSKLESQDD